LSFLSAIRTFDVIKLATLLVGSGWRRRIIGWSRRTTWFFSWFGIGRWFIISHWFFGWFINHRFIIICHY
jgi:hypothetical protein